MNLRRNSFFWALLKINMLPLILLTLVITAFSAIRFAASMNVETKNGLVNLCHTVTNLYDTVYEGDYHIEDDGNSVQMMKGEHLLNDDFSIIDSIKEKTGIDITFFNQDTRVITTIQTNDGVRAIGTKANDTVVNDVLNGSQPHFYSSTMVEGVRYFSYYEPLYAANGSCIGMIFLGKPSAEVERLVYNSIKPTIIFGILTMLIVCLIATRFFNKLVNAIQNMDKFILTIANGELHTKLDADIPERKDELGQMGRNLIKMQRSLRELVEQDILTGLYNRRSGEKLLRRTCENYRKDGIPFCVAIGDIDYFKNVNDTYGHECGDITLAKISERIKEHMDGKGFVARWGGEEMLLVYDNMQLDTAVQCIHELLEEIRAQRITYGDTAFGVTMTFGITEGNDGKVEHIVRDADAKLYEGKNNGRNKIVYEMS
ncbi:MAG: diguanylate cyclase [Lachnospiraceae bacterium]|nr:diguanylate cyclase [Lachnospiraceae bacterium]